MTAPAGAGRPTSLAPGAQSATMLTEYAPSGDDAGLTIINDSPTRAYLADDSGVSASNGVPLDPHTSMVWTNSGQIWAIADSAANAPAVLIVTGAVDAWQPSPAVIGVEVAQQLLQTGVPDVVLESQIVKNQTVPAGQTASFDVSEFACIEASISAPSGGAWALYDAFNNLIQSDTVISTRFILDTSLGATLVVGSTGGPLYISAVGGNRSPLRAYRGAPYPKPHGQGFTGSVGAAAGNVVLIASASLQGLNMLTWAFTGTAKGYLYYVDENGSLVRFCDTSELQTASDGSQYTRQQIIMPPGALNIGFHTATAVAGCSTSIFFTPLI